MLRRFHSLPGLVAALIVSFMALTGAVLSLKPILERTAAPATPSSSVADLASAVLAALPDTESLVRSASGSITAYSGSSATLIDPTTGAALGPAAQSPLFTFFTELHRSLFLGDGGRIAAGVAAGAMIVLAISGILLLLKRMGGWRQLLTNPRGTLSQRLHVELARLAVAGLLLSALTGLYMTLATFGVLSDGVDGFGFPASGSGGTPAPVASLAALQQVPVRDLRELVLPMPGDPADVFTLTTNTGLGYVDQATGALIDFTPNAPAQTVYEAIYTLHTGQGVWWLAALLGASSLAVPALMLTGTIIWLVRRRSLPRFAGDAGWRKADTVILVGSEGNTTWSFAATLQSALRENGHAVHVAPMNSLRPSYPRARHLLVLAATYGNGSAPASARQFLARLERFDAGSADVAVLGFGDRKFRNFCAYAERVAAALQAAGVPSLLPISTIDRQSAQAFAQWGRQLSTALGEPVELAHAPALPRTASYQLVSREDFGVEVQAPTVMLRFAVPRPNGWRRLFDAGSFRAGDLAGILPPGDPIPRYYSIASRRSDGLLEICVRQQPGGVCSDYLFGLKPGDSVQAFVRANPDFQPDRSRRPLVLIGAGAGVAPLVGFVRANSRKRPIHLYFGGRDPDSDFLYGTELHHQLRAGRLSSLVTSFSRVLGGRYVQHRLTDDAADLRRLVEDGARFMVCGSLAMGEGVRAALDAILAPMGLDVEKLQASGRYAEDVY